ncbi:FCD domain-containing protein [Mumia sp. zg.B53]|uniref:FadR/GntR family transcriptional regulator n=1 Tax=Mumia sp. zg.B53 TaxID=2855449 RepID=UPI001C6DE04E|nr:FCD domain-containing protein [Mumia sp. zg.B53]MBW9216133.1 FCD domain-containing protein [Mumia sp. zg.B53]
MTKDVLIAGLAARRSRADHGPDGVTPGRVRNAYQQVADQLLDLILDGTLKAGDRLPNEAELSSIFGVSRSTVREALRALASRDLLETARGTTGGTFVRRVELRQVSSYLETSLGLMSGSADIDVEQMLEAREILEVPAARLAAERRQEDDLTALREAVERERQRRGRGRRFEEHRHFHALVLQCSGNALLEVMTEPVFGVLQSTFLDPDVDPHFWTDVDHDHETILAAIEAGDADAAGRAMSEHLGRLRGSYRDPRPDQR